MKKMIDSNADAKNNVYKNEAACFCLMAFRLLIRFLR